MNPQTPERHTRRYASFEPHRVVHGLPNLHPALHFPRHQAIQFLIWVTDVFSMLLWVRNRLTVAVRYLFFALQSFSKVKRKLFIGPPSFHKKSPCPTEIAFSNKNSWGLGPVAPHTKLREGAPPMPPEKSIWITCAAAGFARASSAQQGFF